MWRQTRSDRGLNDVLQAVGLQILLGYTNYDVSEEERLIEQLLQRRPESTTHMLLGHWYGTEQGELLNRLASQERLIPASGIENEFLDTINQLVRHPERQKFEAQVDKLKTKNYADISELEKLELMQALKEQRRRDEERGRKR